MLDNGSDSTHSRTNSKLQCSSCGQQQNMNNETDNKSRRSQEGKLNTRSLYSSQNIDESGFESVSIKQHFTDSGHSSMSQSGNQQALKCDQLTRAVNILSNRLRLLGQPITETLIEGEAYIPQTSKEFVNKLVEELSALKEREFVSDDSEEEIKQLRKDHHYLENRYRDLEEKHDSLESDINASSEEKDQLIIELRREIDHLSKQVEKRQLGEDKQHSSQLLEIRDLKAKLGVAETTSKHLASRLKEIAIREKALSNQSGSKGAPSADLSKRLTDMSKKLDEAVGANQQWHKYNEDREKKVKELEKANQELEAKQSGITAEQQAHIDRLLEQAKVEKADMERSLQQVLDENRQLRIRVHQLEDERRSNEDSEQVRLLKIQLETYMQDYKTEKLEKEEAVRKYQELRREFDFHKEDHDKLQQYIMEKIHEKRVNTYAAPSATMSCDPYNSPHHMGHPQMVECDADEGNDEVEDEMGYDEVDCPLPSTSPSKEASLQCPHCRKEFLASQHGELLEHIEKCG